MDIKYYTDENDVSPLEKWLTKNRVAIPKVFTAVERLRSGNLWVRTFFDMHESSRFKTSFNMS